MYWASLPSEVRSKILVFLAADNNSASAAEVQKSCLSHYASVCIEWLEFIEKRTYHRLTLRPSCLSRLGKLSPRQKGFVKHIRLRIELKGYTCKSCTKDEPFTRSYSNNRLVGCAIRKLFMILSTWNNSTWNNGNEESGEGTTFELSIYSPSDSKHAFRHYNFDPDISEAPVNQIKTSEIHDPRHGWVQGRRITPLRAPTISIECVALWICLSREVKSITKLVVLRQTRRRISSQTMDQILGKLPKLEVLHWEMWRMIGRLPQAARDAGK